VACSLASLACLITVALSSFSQPLCSLQRIVRGCPQRILCLGSLDVSLAALRAVCASALIVVEADVAGSYVLAQPPAQQRSGSQGN